MNQVAFRDSAEESVKPERQLTHLNLGAYDSGLTFKAGGLEKTYGSLE